MSRDVKSGAPGGMSPPEELRLMNGHLPGPGQARPGETGAVPPPAIASTTPGVSPAVLRHPGAPTLPEPEPMGLTSLVQQYANELFTTPYGALPVDAPEEAHLPPGTTGTRPDGYGRNHAPGGLGEGYGPAGHTPAMPEQVAAPPPPPGYGAASLAQGFSPFESPLDFGALEGSSDPFGIVPQQPRGEARTGRGSDGGAHRGPGGHGVGGDDGDRHVRDGLAFEQPRPGNVPGSGAVPSHPGTSDYEPSHRQAGVYETRQADGLGRTPRHDRALHAEPRFGSPQSGAFDPLAVKREFPILRERVNGKNLVWLDNAATTQKPQTVIDRIASFYEHENSNIHRAAHTLAARATDAYEAARESVRRFVNAATPREIIFVRGATEGINLIAQSWGRRNVGAGDEIVISWLEHHANIVPWQMLCAEKGARLRVAPVDDRGEIILEEYEKLLNPRTRLVAFTQVSNALGTVTPAQAMIEMAHRHGAVVLLDGAQAVSHKRVDVQALGCDFYVLSGHKVFGPTGIGAVYGRSELLETMPPWQGGGNMIEDVTFERTVYQPAPARFEAGTGNIADAVGLGSALDWLTRVGIERVEAYEHELLVYGTERLHTVPGLTMIGNARDKAGVLSFVLAGQKTQDVGGMLDREGIAVRSGHHCAQPILRRFGLEATVRASLAPYNTKDDLDQLVHALRRIQLGSAI